MGFKVGEKLVYPNHGVTVVEHIGESAIMEAGENYYHLRLLAPTALTSLLLLALGTFASIYLYHQQAVTADILSENIGSRHAADKLEVTLQPATQQLGRRPAA